MNVDDGRVDGRCRLLVAFVTAFAAMLYVYRLGMQSFWYDEAASFANARLSWRDFGVAMHHRDVFFAAYYAFLHLWMVFGTDEATLRMPSVVGAVAALPCMFALGNRLFGKRAGVAAMTLLASNNLFLLHVREARPYAWLVLAAIVASLAFVRALDTNKISAWAWYGAACAVGAYVHVFALLVPLSHALSLAFFPGKRPWKRCLLVAGAIAVGVAPLLLLVVGQESTSGRVFAGHGNPRDVIYLFRIFCGSKISALLYVALGALVYIRYLRARATRTNGAAFDSPESYSYALLLCWMLAPPFATLIVSHFVPLFLETYLLVALPPLLLLVAGSVASLQDVRIVFLATMLFVGLQFPGVLKTYGEHGEKEDWRGAVALATAHVGPRDALAVFPATDAASIAYYERKDKRSELPAIVYPNERTYRVWRSSAALDMSSVQEEVGGYARVWVFANEDAPGAQAQAQLFGRALGTGLLPVRSDRFTHVFLRLYERTRE